MGLIGTVLYLDPISYALGTDMDNDVSDDYARSVSRTDDRIVQWSCSNGDRGDVRYYSRGEDITAQVGEHYRQRDAREVRAQLDGLTAPYQAAGVTVEIRPVGEGRVRLTLDGVSRDYAPGEIRARDGASDGVRVAFDEMRRRAVKIVSLARAIKD